MELTFTVKGRVAKPIAEVFDAVVDPEKLSAYFTTGGASAPLEAGSTVTWDFADFPGAFPVKVLESEPHSRIVLEWGSSEGGYDTYVEFGFEALGPEATMVSIRESGWKETQAGLEASYGNCQGWMHMLCCLKLYLERGIILREGFFT